MLFSAGLCPFVALVGPTGWGKTHLLDAVAGTLRANDSEVVRVHAASDWLGNANRPETRVLLLDDVTDVLSRPRARQQLRIVLERRARAGKPTMLALTAPSITRSIRSALPCPREWTLAPIESPTPDERETVVRHVASCTGLKLSETIIRLIAARAAANGRSITGALQRLKLVDRRWVGAHAVLRACGILQPHLSDATGWDLRDHVNDVLGREWASQPHSPTRTNRVGVYLMLHAMGLSEDEVARYYRLQPGEAYAAAQEFASECANLEVRRAYGAFVDSLVRSFEAAEG